MSTMNKRKIKELVSDGGLIVNGFDESNIKEACYEASTSNDFFEIYPEGTKKIFVPDGEEYVLRPNNQVVCVTKEYFDIPLDRVARVVLKGHYFSLGIAPVNTYADPGFKGRLGIIFSNTSRNYIKIGPNDKIVKIEFASMIEPCETGYVGQHGGDVTIWPFRADLIADEQYLKRKNINPTSAEELERIYGKLLKSTIYSSKRFGLNLGIATLLATILPLTAIWGLTDKWDFSSPALMLGIGVVTGIIANTIFLFFTKRLDA